MNFLSRCMALAFVVVPSVASAAELGVDGMTIVRFEERSVPGFAKEKVIPATQFLRVDAERLGGRDLSFHLYGWGRADLEGRSSNAGTTEGDLTYAYLDYRLPSANGALKLGRFFVFEGVAAEQLDGVSARIDLQKGFTAALFGGAPVKLDSNDKGDYVVGGRVSYRAAGVLELGASALREGGAATGRTDDLKDYRELAGVDLWLAPHRMVELTGRTSYNLATEGVAEQSYLLLVKPSNVLSVSGEYNENSFKDYFASTNLRSLFNPDTGDRLRSYGGSVTYAVAKPVQLIANFRRINYAGANRGNAYRYGAEAKATLADNKLRSGLSYNRNDAANDAVNSYHEIRAYALYDASGYFCSLDAITQLYDDPIDTKDTGYELAGSLGYRVLPNLSVSGDLSFGSNPRLTEELRGVLRATYNFAHEGAR